MIEAAGMAKAHYDAFKETHPDAYIDDFSDNYPVVIDGRFHLHVVGAATTGSPRAVWRPTVMRLNASH